MVNLTKQPEQLENYLASLPCATGKWLKAEIYYKVKQRSKKIIIDEIKVSKV